jgi:hypothetical protein
LKKEDKVYVLSSDDEIVIYSYYEITRSKLKLIMLSNIEVVDIIGENRIQTFDVTNEQSWQLYQMTYKYFRFKKWR